MKAELGTACDVCERIGFDDKVAPLSTARSEEQRNAAFGVLSEYHPQLLARDAQVRVCGTCKESLVRGRLPHLSTANGYVYPPIPPGLPKLNAVEERLVAPRLPFVCMRRLTHVRGQCGIKAEVLNVPTDVSEVIKSLPRHVSDDVVVEVHLKGRLMHKSTYKRGMVKKANIKAWLDYLVQTPLYRFYNITVDEDNLDAIPDDDDEDLDELEEIDEIKDLEDPLEYVAARDAVAQTVLLDEATLAADLLQQYSHFLALAPGEGKTPISLFDDNFAEELSFPQIYLGEPRKVNSKPFQKATSEIRRKDRRGAAPAHVLYMAAKVMRFNVVDQTVTFRTNASTDAITRQQLEYGDFVKDAIDRDLAFMRGIPNTVMYWQERKREVSAMIRQLGKPNAFLTMSASEVHWDKLIAALHRLQVQSGREMAPVEELTDMQRVELCNDDPVAVAMYCDRIFGVLLSILQDKRHSPFRPYVVLDYFKHVEFQQHGSPQVHILLWLDNVPDEELSTDMPKTVEMMEALVSLDADSLRRPQTQVHQHTSTCYKKGSRRCRFGAPFMPMKTTRVIVPFPPTDNANQRAYHVRCKEQYHRMRADLEHTDFDSITQFWRKFGVRNEKHYVDVLRAGISRPCLMLARTVQQKWINQFNLWIARHLDSNMDLQVVIDYNTCARYIADYMNKADRGTSNMYKAVAKIVHERPDMNYEQLLRMMGANMLSAIEMPAQEAAWFLLGQPMSEKSRSVAYIPTCFPEERTRVRKTQEQMAAENLSASSTDVWKLNKIQRYEDRPEKLRNLCLADFVSLYRYDLRIKRYVKRTHQIVIRYRNYSAERAPLDYKRECVLLYVPFDREVDVLDGNAYERLYEENLDMILERKRKYNRGCDFDEMIRELDAASNDAPTTTAGDDCGGMATIHRDRDTDFLHDPECVRALASESSCAAVCKREDVMDVYYVHLDVPDQP